MSILSAVITQGGIGILNEYQFKILALSLPVREGKGKNEVMF
jgi:hypothetical protein